MSRAEAAIRKLAFRFYAGGFDVLCNVVGLLAALLRWATFWRYTASLQYPPTFLDVWEARLRAVAVEMLVYHAMESAGVKFEE